MNVFQLLKEIQVATLAARERTGLNIATKADRGVMHIEVVSYDAKGIATIVPVSSRAVPLNKVVEVLNAI